jgi:hypothetical protein
LRSEDYLNVTLSYQGDWLMSKPTWGIIRKMIPHVGFWHFDAGWCRQTPKSGKQIHLLTLTLTPPDKPGAFDASFSVTIKGRRQPVTFHATGRILDQAVSNVTR